MQSNHHHRETNVSFHKSGGHSHDGVNSTRIDFSSYSDAELAPLVAKITKKIKAGGSDDDSERSSIESQPTDDLIPTGAPLVVTLTSGYNDASSGWGDNTGWIQAEWTVYEAPGDITGDDDADDLLEVGYMEGDGSTAVDDTDVAAVVLDEIQSAEAINEYQISYWNIAFEDVDHLATPEHKKFVRSDENKVLIAPVPLGKTFHVRVRGISGNGKHSDPASNDASSHILVGGGGFSETPSAPTGLDAISMGPDSIMLTWDESTHPLVVNGGNYRVQCDTANTFNSNAGNPLYARTVGGESTTFTGLSQGTSYYFRVKAKTSTGVLSNWSSTLGPETTTSLGPGDISDGNIPGSSPTPKITGGPKYLYVKWEPITNNDPVTYEVHLGTSSTFTANSSTKCGEVTGSSFVIRYLPNNSATELSYGTNYYVRVWAKDTDGYATNPAPTGTLTATQCQKIAGGVGGDILADSITANDINSLTITGTKYVQAGGASVTDPYVRMEAASVSETSINTGHLDIYPGKQYAGTENVIAATLEGGSNASTKEVWTYLSSPYFSGDTYASRPVYIKMLTDNDDSTKSELTLASQKLIITGRQEGISLYRETDFTLDSPSAFAYNSVPVDFNTTGGGNDIVGGNYWSMMSESSSETTITLNTIGQWLITATAIMKPNSTTSWGSGERAQFAMKVTRADNGSGLNLKDFELARAGGLAEDYLGNWMNYTLSGSMVIRANTTTTKIKLYLAAHYEGDTSPAKADIVALSAYRLST